LGAVVVPYQFRHSGPSWDILQGLRSLAEVQKRGRWKAFSSVCRYEKSGRSLQGYEGLSESMRRHCQSSAVMLEEVILGRCSPLFP